MTTTTKAATSKPKGDDSGGGGGSNDMDTSRTSAYDVQMNSDDEAAGAVNSSDSTRDKKSLYQDKEESSSTGSDGGKGSGTGSGSGGGYSADCSSSDTSSVGNGKSGGSSGEGDGDGDEGTSSSGDAPGGAMTQLRIGDSSTGETIVEASTGLHEQPDVDDQKPAALPSSKTDTTRSSDNHHYHHHHPHHHHPSQPQIEDRATNTWMSDTHGHYQRPSIDFDQAGDIDHTGRRWNSNGNFVQWNGVRVKHPMDPRIDLSTVGYVKLPAVAKNERAPSMQLSNEDQAALQYALGSGHTGSSETGSSSEQPHVPSLDQYMKLMESVRPFFNAHGLSNDGSRSQQGQGQSSSSSGRFSSEFASTSPSDNDQKLLAPALAANIAADTVPNVGAATMKEPPADAGRNVRQYDGGTSETHPGDERQARDDDEVESDSSSMVVLARRKKKHTMKEGDDGDGTQNGSSATTNTNGGSTFHSAQSGSSSSVSEERRIRIQQAPRLNRNAHQDEAADGDSANDDAGVDMDVEDGANDVGNAHAQRRHILNEHGVGDADHQESTSSSSDDRNGQPVPDRAPLQFGVPAVVSEYSSSARNGSSGASNTHGASTSGSGSGGNTGSGTGSGSNQGGSSGSGNDQGISSNGNGSSGSGNDIKGSSEEKEDNSAENYSGENSGGNSDVSNSAKIAATKVEVPNANGSAPGLFHHHPYHHWDDNVRAPEQHGASEFPEDENAAREKKIQNKKRKRMNMRREYEEKVEEEMASSESSQDHGIVLRPGKPVTLDKVLSFTKKPRLVAKAEPPFLVVYTNAAYSRLSGIDSHNAVGKPLSSLLSTPDQYELSQLDFDKDLSSAQESPSKHRAIGKDSNRGDLINVGDDRDNYVAAAAAGRAAALAAPTGDASNVGIDTLVVNSGFGRINMVSVRSKMHHMVGRNIKVFKSMVPAKKSQTKEERSNDDSSITSNFDGTYQSVACTMCVSPVVSSPEAYHVVTDRDQSSHHYDTKRSEKDHDSHLHKAKRKKHHHHYQAELSQHVHLPHRRPHMMKEIAFHNRPQLVSHYVIQLEPFDSIMSNVGMMESSTSTTFDGRKLGVSKNDMTSERSKEEMRSIQGADSNDHQQGPPPNNDEYDEDVVDMDDDEAQTEESETREHVSAIG